MPSTLLQDFLQVQIRTIQGYLQECGASDENSAILHWIEKNAAQYRQSWEQQMLLQPTCHTH